MTDQEIINSIQSSNRKRINEALKVLYKANFDSVKALVLKTYGNEQDAADVFQSAMLVVYEQVKSGKFQGNSLLKTYIYAISRNLWFKTLKKRSPEQRIDTAHEMLVGISHVELEHLVIAYESKLTFPELLEQLGESCKEVLTDFYYKGMSLEEIAVKFDLANDSTAKNKKYRCMVKLMTLIKNRNIEMEDLDIESS